MLSLEPWTISFTACIAGGGSHVGFFHKGEHHLYPQRYLQVFILACAFVVLIFSLSGETLQGSLRTTAFVASAYLIGLYTSLITYRVFIHPLNKFPGPWPAKLSSLWFPTQLKNLDSHGQLQHLHQKYDSDFIRIGSNDLSITHPKAVQIVYGQGSKCTKAAWYDMTHPVVSLQTYRTKTLHDRRRHLWSGAFSDKALRGYEARIRKYRDVFFAQIDAADGQPLDAKRWFKYLSFDVMGDMAFGSGFDMLKNQEEHWAIRVQDDGVRPIGYMLPPWLFRTVAAIPGAATDFFRQIAYCKDRVLERRQIKPDIPDLMAALLRPLEGRELSQEEEDLLTGESRLIILAGSDTSSNTMVFATFELCRHPEQVRKLRDQLESVTKARGEEIPNETIQNLQHLNAVIYETLRLYPAIPGAIQRLTPPEGIFVNSVHVPGNMTVYCPQYVIGRKEEIYPRANEFIPERWYQYPDMVKEKSAWAPFSAGPYNCIGKPLAMSIMRATIARLVLNYDIEFGPSVVDNGRSFEMGCIDHFVINPPALPVCFKRRKFEDKGTE